MRILDRYISKEFLRILALCIAAGIVIFLVVDLFENMGKIIERRASWKIALQFFVYKIPYIVSMGLPMAVLLAGTISLGILAKNVEITAMKAGGIGIHRIAMPILVLAAAASIFLLALNETVTPYTNERVNYIKENYIEKEKTPTLATSERTWFRSRQNSILSMEFYDIKARRMINVAMFFFDRNFNLIMTLNAKEALWDEEARQWRLSEVYQRDFTQKDNPKITPLKEMMVEMEESPESLGRTQKKPDEMSFVQLYQYVKRMRAGGIDVTRYMVDLYDKIAYPFACLMMVMVGLPFAMRATQRTGNVVSLVASIVLGFSFFFVHSLFITLGRSGDLYAVLAAWMPNLLFLGLGVYIFKNTPS